VHALFSSYDLNPELFERRCQGLPERHRRRLTSVLRIARDYALFRERAYQQDRESPPEAQSDRFMLLRTLPVEARHEAREWIGFWAQFRQGHWSDLEWVERGVRTHVNFDTPEFFARLLVLRPKSFILIHNHPSGRTEPSWMDHQLTHRLAVLAAQFGIELLGHWIVGPHSETWITPPTLDGATKRTID
jgi:DNA repair protein RadC